VPVWGSPPWKLVIWAIEGNQGTRGGLIEKCWGKVTLLPSPITQPFTPSVPHWVQDQHMAEEH
jgi:hypothetical protein